MPSILEQDTVSQHAELQDAELERANLSQQLLDDLIAINLCELKAELGVTEAVRDLATGILPFLRERLKEHLRMQQRLEQEETTSE